MKKLVLLTFVLVILALSAFAQGEVTKGITSKGVKAGFVESNLTGDIEGNKMMPGFAGGGFITYSFSPVFAIQPEVLFCMKGTQEDTDASDKEKIKLNYLTVPVLLKYMVPTQGSVSPNFFAGPELGFLMSAKDQVGSEKVDIKDAFKNIDFGLAFGAGVDFKTESVTIMFDGRYTLGLSNIVDVEGSTASLKNGVLMFMLGVGF